MEVIGQFDGRAVLHLNALERGKSPACVSDSSFVQPAAWLLHRLFGVCDHSAL
jgi:hypothetical protein